MSGIHQNGTVWRDDSERVWSTSVDVFGVRMTAYAIEMEFDPEYDRWLPAKGDPDAEYYWIAYDRLVLSNSDLKLFDLADMKCVVVVF